MIDEEMVERLVVAFESIAASLERLSHSRLLVNPPPEDTT